MGFGEELQRKRMHMKLTQSTLADAAGVSVPTVRSLEHGNGSVASLTKLMTALELRPSWVEGENEWGYSLAKHRKAKGLTQRQVAGRIGSNQVTIWKLETKFTGTASTLVQYLEMLGASSLFADPSKPVAKRLVPKKNDPESDLVFTPHPLAMLIIDHFRDNLTSKHVLDPCRGGGAFYDQFPDDCNKHWCEISDGIDFMDWAKPVDWIITNPPWSKLRSFLQHSMAIADNIVFLAAYTHFTTKARINDIREAGFGMKTVLYVPTPKNWPHSGFQMAAVHLSRDWNGPCETVYVEGY